MKFFVVLVFIGAACGQWDPHFVSGRNGIVQLFEWHWDTIANECETFLSKKKFAGVQISPPTENRIVEGRPWWERYQPVSYKLGTISGDRAALENMIDRCNAVGVRIYADAVINHMCGEQGWGIGTAGSFFNATARSFPAVSYSRKDFNDKNCHTASGNIENYNDPYQVRNCKLVSLLDLNQGMDYVRGKIASFMNDLISLGVAGFRVDACKHMWPGDLQAIFRSLDDLSTAKGFSPGTRPFIYQEVIDEGGEPITASQYFGNGRVTNFMYGVDLGNNVNTPQYLKNFGQDWGMMPSDKAVVFLNNHDNQRGHGGGGRIITFKEPKQLKMYTGFMMAWPYGVKRIMSSYRFNNTEQGPPDYQRRVNAEGTCEGNWVCEHRWPEIRNLPAFAVAAEGQEVLNLAEGNGKIAFSRGNKAFFALSTKYFSGFYKTGLPSGQYCNVVEGNFENNKCTGPCIIVDENSYAYVTIEAMNFVAIHVDAPCNCKNGDCITSVRAHPPGECSSCSMCGRKVDCGHMGTEQEECERNGCLWCPVQSGNDPWCIYRTGVPEEDEGSCLIEDSQKQDCGYMGVNEEECEEIGCCWAESNQPGVSWCFYKA